MPREMVSSMFEDPSLDPRIHAAARGRVDQLMTHLNSRGRAWATFTLETSAGALRCMCFPDSYKSIRGRLQNGRLVVIHGQVATRNELEMRVLTAAQA